MGQYCVARTLGATNVAAQPGLRGASQHHSSRSVLNLLETALGTSAVVQPDAPAAEQSDASYATPAPPSGISSRSTQSVETNTEAPPFGSPRPDSSQDRPRSLSQECLKERLQSFIGTHCVKGDNCNVGTVRFRSALANHLGLESGRRHIVKLMKDEGFKVGTARPKGGKPHSSYKGIALASSS